MPLYHCPLNLMRVQIEVTLSFKCQFGLCLTPYSLSGNSSSFTHIYNILCYPLAGFYCTAFYFDVA